MHPNAARPLHLLYRAENALSPESLLSDPFLSSRFALLGGIPVSDLLSENSFIQMNAEQDEVVEACKRSRILSVMPVKIDGEYYILPGYMISPNCLILRQVQSVGTIDEIACLIEWLTGTKDFKVAPVGNAMDYFAAFGSIEDCFAFWRALKYSPFKGAFIQSEIYSPVLQRIVPANNDNHNSSRQNRPKFSQVATQTVKVEKPDKNNHKKPLLITGQSKKNIVF